MGVLGGFAISLGASLLGAGLTYALTPTQKIEQGRVNSLLPGTVGYGQTMPMAWGTVRLPGQRIWQDYLEETKKKTKQGKGAKVETEEYNYYGYYTEVFCQTPFRPIVDFNRVWLNKKIVYSKIGTAESIAEGQKFADRYLRFYKGNAASAIDPLMASVESINSYNYGLPANREDKFNYLRSVGLDPSQLSLTPAYNYRALMVAQRLPLEDYFNAIPGGEAEIIASENCSVGQIVGDIMSLFFDTSRYDVSLIDNIPVKGFTVDSVGAAKNVIQTLQQAYFFDVVNSGGVFKFIPLDQPRVVINLNKEELAAHISGSQKPLDYEIVEKDPTSLPSKVFVKYIDPDLNYDANEQCSGVEVQSHYNNRPTRLEFNLVMSATEAATIADRALALAHLMRYTYKFKLPPAYLAIEPADLMRNLFDESGYPLKITQTRIGANLILDCEATAHDTYFWQFTREIESGDIRVGVADYNLVIFVNGSVNSVADNNGNIYTEGIDYTVNNDGNIEIISTGNIPEGTELIISTTAQPTQSDDDAGSIISSGNTELLILDIPLLRNDEPDYSLYLTAGGGNNWNGASIYYSIDNSRYILIATQNTYGVYGSVVSYSVTNNLPEIEVLLNKAELESVTDADISLGFNFALIGNKIYQFKTAQLISTNTYRLSELSVGLRGTEQQNDPVIGDRFVLLTGENAVITRIQASESDIGQIRYFKALSSGQALDEVNPITITYQGISMRPYAPINLAATKNAAGDITITWDRRDRRDQTENPQLNEEVEGYEVNIIDNSSTSIRTISSDYDYTVYTANDQTADFGSPQSTITVKVAQVSSSFGLGEYSDVTVLTV